jgi:hypothetical protein
MLLIVLCLDWLSPDQNEIASWNTVTTDRVIFFEQFLQVQRALTEKDDQALDTTVYFGMQQVSSQILDTGLELTYACIGK